MIKNITLQNDIEQLLLDDNLDFQKFNNSTLFVTGATGLIGSLIIRYFLYISEKLLLNIHVIGLARDINKSKEIYGTVLPNNVKLIFGDITQNYETYLDTSLNIDYIFHTASVTSSKEMIIHPVLTIMTAVDGTNQMLRLAAEKNVKRMVYVSSMEMYGSFNSDDICDENKLGFIDPLAIRSNYPESKRLCENLCVAYASEYNVRVKIARLSQTFGAGILPWENRIFAQFARSVIEKKDIVLHTRGLSEGNYCYTSDTISGLLTILLNGTDKEAYNIVNEQTHTTILGMAQMVCESIAHNEIKVVFDIPENNIFGYAADTKLKLSGKKLEALGWSANINLPEMYKRTISYLKQLN